MLELSEIEDLILTRAKTPHFTAFHQFFLENPEAIPLLIQLALSGKKHPVPAYGAWLLVHIAKAKPQLLYKLQAQLEEGLLQTKKHDIQRNLLVVLLHLPLRHQNEGNLLKLYFSIFQDHNLKVANRVYALYHLKRMVKKISRTRRWSKGSNEFNWGVRRNETGAKGRDSQLPQCLTTTSWYGTRTRSPQIPGSVPKPTAITILISARRGNFKWRFKRFSSKPSKGQLWKPSAAMESMNVWAAKPQDLWVTTLTAEAPPVR